MKSRVQSFITNVMHTAKRRAGAVHTRSMGRERKFFAYDVGDDTFIFEVGVYKHVAEHASVLMVEKCDLKRGAPGRVLTITTGNHSVAAMPLLDGTFWALSSVRAGKRSSVLTEKILCANVVGRRIEISQREISAKRLVAFDEWLTGTLGFGLEDVVMLERNDATLTYFRSKGQEWRVKPLAWTEMEMRLAISASRKRISSRMRYCHSVKGVHFLSIPDFAVFVARAKTDWDEFSKELRELVGVFAGNRESFIRQSKFHGHHEIEIFGLPRGWAVRVIVPRMERLMESIVLGRAGQAEAATEMEQILSLVRLQVASPDLLDDKSPRFIESMYMHLTGEVYNVMGDGSSRAFDDRRTALPGATYVCGRPVFHPGVDMRSHILLSNLRAFVSRDEQVEYANVYELRTNDMEESSIGSGRTREVVYKTNRRPLVYSLVEKRLREHGEGYASYVLARTQAFRALGVSLAEYRLLKHRAGESATAATEYFIRTRFDGWPLLDIPAVNYQMAGEFGGSEAGEDPVVVKRVAFLLGDAAAQTMILKKYDPATMSSFFGCGKEIFSFEFDDRYTRIMPQTVSLCSVRGSMGWPDWSLSEENLANIASFYMAENARVLRDFASQHPSVPLQELAESFWDGLAFRTRTTDWRFALQRESFESFDPGLPRRYKWKERWMFALWALERQMRRLPSLKKSFFASLALA